MDNIRPIKTEDDYNWALAEVTQYFDNQPEPGTPDADRFDVLSDLIEAYEDRHWPIEAPDPVQAIAEILATRGLKQSDLADVIGSRSRASEVLRYRRPLTLGMIQNISGKLHISADILIRPYHLDDKKRA